jgi:hypothetical protein
MREFVTRHEGWEAGLQAVGFGCEYHKLWGTPMVLAFREWMAVTLRPGNRGRTFLT